jgi:MtN3 and saliva related transmembrane protein
VEYKIKENVHMQDIVWYAIGSMAAFLTMFGFVPQIIKIIKTKFVRDISFVMLIQISIGTFLWILYGIHIGDPIVSIANVIALTTLIISILLYIKYRSNTERQEYSHNEVEKPHKNITTRFNCIISKICRFINNRGF